MLFLLILLAPAVILVASTVERRLGAAAAGWAAALPVAFAVALTAVRIDAGSRAAGTMALSAAGHVPAQIAFAVSFAAALRTRRPSTSAAAGTAAFVAVSLLLVIGGPAIRIALAVVALLVGPRLIRHTATPPQASAGQRQRFTTISCLAAAAVVASATLTSRIAGPAAAGTIAAFPTISTTLALAVARRSGRPAAIRALQGLTRSLPCYFTFCLAIAFTVPVLPLLASAGIALAACAAAGRLTWRTVRPAAG